MKHRNKKLLIVLVLSIFLIGIGYAFLSSTLTINGIGAFSKNSWLIYFDDIRPATGSVETASQPAIITNPEKTNIQFDVDLNTPGDFYEFDVYIKNDGTIDAMIDEVIMPELTEEQKKYMKFSYTYVDGTRIKKCDELKAQNFRDTRLRVEYLEDADLDIMPDEGMTHFDVTITYVQESECELDEIDVELDPNGGIYNETTEVTTVTLSTGQTYDVGLPTREGYTFVKWKEITESESYSNNVVTFNGKNVRLQAQWILSDEVVARIDREESIYYVTIQAAIDDARSGEMIHLLKNTSEVFTNNKNVTLNLEGYKVTGSGTNLEGYSLTIINGSIENTDGVGFVNKGTLTLGIDDGRLCELWKPNPNCAYENGFVSILGTTRGLTQEGTFNFYDGFVEGEIAIIGGANDTAFYIDPDSNDEIELIVFVDNDIIRNDQKMYLKPPSRIEVSMTRINGNVYYKNLSDNFKTSSVTGYKIYAIRDFEGAYKLDVPEDTTIVFDIDGYQVDIGDIITNKGTLNLMNSKSTGHLNLGQTIDNNGTLNINDLLMEEVSVDRDFIKTTGESIINVTNSSLKTHNGNIIKNNADTIINLDDSSILTSTDKDLFNNEIGTLTINNLKNIDFYNYAISASQNTTTNLNNSEFEASKSKYLFYGQSTSNLNLKNVTADNYSINRGNITLDNVEMDCKDIICIGDSNITMNSGHLKSNINVLSSITGTINDGIIESNNQSGVINSTITFNNGSIIGGLYGVANTNLTMKGGSIEGGTYGIYGNNSKSISIINSSTIKGGTYGIYANTSSNNITIGENDETINRESPVITGGTHGIYKNTGAKVYYYDGILKGTAKAYECVFDGMPSGTEVFIDSETIDETIYETAYLKKQDPFLKVENDTYSTFDALLEEHSDDSNIKVEVIANGRVVSPVLIPDNNNVEIDMKGYTIELLAMIESRGNLIIKDTSTSENKGKLKAQNANFIMLDLHQNLTLEDITIDYDGLVQTIMCENTCTFELTDVNIISNGSSFMHSKYRLTSILNNVNADFTGEYFIGSGWRGWGTTHNSTINSGNIKLKKYLGSDSNITMNGGTITNYETSYDSILRDGTITLNDGTIKNISSSAASAIRGATFTMNGGTIESKTIGLDNLYQGNIIGGTIKTDGVGVNLSVYTVTVGEDDGNIDITSPIIISKTYAINKTGGTLNFYDGILKGGTFGYNGTFTQLPDGATVKDDTTETIGEDEYHLAYLVESEPFLRTSDGLYNSFNKIINENEDASSIDVEVIANGVIKSPQNLSIDINLELNGHTIELENSITNQKELTITDSSNTHTGKIFSKIPKSIINNNIITLENGTIESTYKYNTNGLTIDNKGTLNLNGEYSIVNFLPDDDNLCNYGEAINGGITNLNGGKVNSCYRGIGNSKLTINDNSIIEAKDAVIGCNTTMISGTINASDEGISGSNTTMTGGTINAKIGVHGGSINFSGGIINSQDCGISGSYNGASVDAIMSGGTINSENDGVCYYMYATITGGTINANKYGINYWGGTLTIGEEDGNISTSSPVIKAGNIGIYRSITGTINFYDGIIKAKAETINTDVNDIEVGSSFTLGTEADPDDSENPYITQYLIISDEFITNTTKGKSYKTINSAMSEADDGDEFEFTDNGNEYRNVVFDKNVTIDLKGFDLKTINGLNISSGKTLNLVNSSSDKSEINTSLATPTIFQNDGTLNIDNIKISRVDSSNSYKLINNSGSININNSILQTTGGYNINKANNNETTIKIKNSTISGGQIRTSGEIEFDSCDVSLSLYVDTNSEKKVIMKNNSSVNLNSSYLCEDVDIDNTILKGGIYTCSGTNSYTLNIDNSTIDATINTYFTSEINNSSLSKPLTIYNDTNIDTLDVDGNENDLMFIINGGNNNMKDITIDKTNIPGHNYISTLSVSKNASVNIEGFDLDIINKSGYGGSNFNNSIVYVNNGTVTASDFNITHTTAEGFHGGHTQNAIRINGGTFTYLSGSIKLNGGNARGVTFDQSANNTSEFIMGEKEPNPTNSNETADVSLTNPLIEVIGTQSGIGIDNITGSVKFYDGKFLGSTKARTNIIFQGVEYLWEVKTFNDDNNYEYCILKYMSQPNNG